MGGGGDVWSVIAKGFYQKYRASKQIRSYKMNIETFLNLISSRMHIGDNFTNPGGAKPGDGGGYGYRTVKTITMDKIVYFGAGTKKEVKITLPIQTFYDVILEFQSSCCYTW
jgi:hypothetical protein